MGSNQQDFNNQAFVPYATNGGETTYVPNGKYDTLADCKDDGYVKPFVNVDPNKNHEYENPSEVAKRAGLNRAGSGPRRKKNQLYGDTKKQRVRLPDTPTTPTDGAESSPLVVAIQQEHEKSKTRKCDIKMVIFFIVVLCLSAGGLALSLLNMLNKENCLCSRRELPVAPVVGSNQGESYDDTSLIAKLDKLQKQYEDLKKQMEQQRQELEKVNKSATFKPKLLPGRQGVQGPIGPKGPKGDQGPKGIQGIQGPQGVPGMGNVSRCTHKTKNGLSTVLENMATSTRAKVTYKEPQDMKVMAATCSTSHDKGPGAAYLLTKEVNGILQYTCECAGISVYGSFKPTRNRDSVRQMECIIHIWECPL